MIRLGDVSVRTVLRAAAIGWAFSGVPSTVHSLATGRSPLLAARAAGELLCRPGLVRGAVAHTGLSLWWAAILAGAHVERRPVPIGAAAGVAIAALDLSIARRWFPAIDSLPTVPQVLDHALFGALVARSLARS